jgi:hypothetical protein
MMILEPHTLYVDAATPTIGGASCAPIYKRRVTRRLTCFASAESQLVS